MQLGVIADDFTGATDIASFLVRNGMPTVQLNGVPTRDIPLTSEAVVISLKTRSCPAEMAVSQSLAALRWLQAQGCQQFLFQVLFHWHCCKVSDEAAFCLIQRPYISKTLLTRRISPRDHHNKMLRPGLCVVHASPQYL